jgi:hypothetical protein
LNQLLLPTDDLPKLFFGSTITSMSAQGVVAKTPPGDRPKAEPKWYRNERPIYDKWAIFYLYTRGIYRVIITKTR